MESSIPIEIDLKLTQRRLDDTIKYYRELRDLYQEATGILFIPAELYPSEVTAVTAEDKRWLKDLGISLEGSE